jgi:hypothetical protein
MSRGGHGLPKVLPGPAMPDPSTPCRLAAPETALWLFQRCPAHRTGGLRPSLDTPRRTPFTVLGISPTWIRRHNLINLFKRVSSYSPLAFGCRFRVVWVAFVDANNSSAGLESRPVRRGLSKGVEGLPQATRSQGIER